MRAKTKSKWIKLPPILIEKPNNQRMKKITTAVQIIFTIIASLKIE
jgi:hypothetical protein